MLKKAFRVPSKKILEIIKSRKRFFHPLASLFVAENNTGRSRFSVIVPVKLSKKSSKRNPLRRKTSEIIRKNIFGLRAGFDCVLIFKPGSLQLSSKEIQEILFSLFEKAGIKV